MLYNIDENRDAYYDMLDYLDEQVYLTEEESLISPYQIPIISLNEQNFIHFDYIKQLSSDESIESILDTLTETHNLDNLSIALPEYELLVNPFLIESNINFELLPISEDSIAYQFCEACIDAFAESGEEEWLGYLLEEKEIEKIFKMNLNAKKAIEIAKKAGADSNYTDIINNSTQRKIYNDVLAPALEKAKQDAKIRKEAEEEKARKEDEERRIRKYNEKKKKELAKDITKAPKVGKGRDKSLFNKGYHLARYNIKSTQRDLQKAWDTGKGFTGTAKELAGAAAKHKGTLAAGAVAVGGAGLALKKFVDYRKRVAWEAKNKPRTWLAKKIASLRSIYQKYLARARAARDKGQASIFQKVASTILGIIDALMKRLQKAVN